MKRWNIANIFFLGVEGQIREVALVPDAVNIITGGSGTGKSALIKAIDYCLGSGKCELPAHVRRRSVAVGVKWVLGDSEMIVGRVIPPVGQGTSTHMFVSHGRKLPLPSSVEEFDGATTVEAAKAFIERAFGIGDLADDSPPGSWERGRATVRHVTPYLFVTKEVIDSESVLLHGLEKVDKARDITASMPYFLRVTDEASVIAERRLRQLQRVLDREEVKERSQAASETALRQRAVGLLTEAHRIGLLPEVSPNAPEVELMSELRVVLRGQVEVSAYPSENELASLHAHRRDVLSRIEAVKRQSRATKAAVREASGFQGAVARQHQKLELAEHLHLQEVSQACPLCEAPSERGRATAHALQETLAKIREESVAVERVKPQLVELDGELDKRLEAMNAELRDVDGRIRSWLQQNESARELANLTQLKTHLMGRISFFLETSVDEPLHGTRDLSVLRNEIEELEARVDRDAKRAKLQHAERKISQFASEAFAQLPTVAPCVGSELEFSSRVPEVTIMEKDSGAVLRMPDVGSDQNYLAIHIALSFALQRYFESVNAPVPGVLVLDQISRPYFPARGEDEAEIAGGEEDEDIQAMRRHIDFLFSETARRKGLQVLLIEHAFFADDDRYQAATRERWTKVSGRALIPLDWPTRMDG